MKNEKIANLIRSAAAVGTRSRAELAIMMVWQEPAIEARSAPTAQTEAISFRWMTTYFTPCCSCTNPADVIGSGSWHVDK